MRKLIPVAASAVLLPLTLTACGGSSAATTDSAGTSCTAKLKGGDLVKSGTLTMSTNATLPPMQYVGSDGKVTGMRIDLGNEIAKGLCLKPVFVNVDFDSQIPGAQGGRWDMIDTGMFYTPERAKTIKLVPYEVQGVAVSVPKGNPKGVHTEDDLSGQTIAVEAPGYEYDTLKALNTKFQAAGKPKITLRTFQTNANAYQALAAGQVGGVAIVESVTTYYQGNGRFETAVKGMNTAPLALGFGKQSTADAVAGELDRLKKSGYLTKLFKKYNVTPYSGAIKVTTGTISAK
jgi:polar amino acid transport system substrate-binding protein